MIQEDPVEARNCLKKEARGFFVSLGFFVVFYFGGVFLPQGTISHILVLLSQLW